MVIKTMPHDDATERFCNRVAAELLVAESEFKPRWDDAQKTGKPFESLARWFKVSPIVAARRALDLGLISRPEFLRFYEQQQAAWAKRKAEEKEKRKGGPGFYDVQDVRLGRRFAEAVTSAARAGRLSYRDAYRLTDLHGDTFNQYADRLLQRMKDERR
jgi:Zn-dependent peptidase ImmA (M78 family)